ncbi:MAG TPA: ATP-dependent RecD-like DNA helicase [Polyangiaceae bacterium]
MPNVVTVTGEVERVTFENEDTGFRVLRLARVEGELGRRPRLTVVGTSPAIGPGTRVRATGYLVDDARHGEQLRAESIVLLSPESREGIERYLGSGVLPGVGEVLAKRIVNAFGTETLTILDSQPERLQQVQGLSAKKVGTIKRHWAEHRAESTSLVLLQGYGMSPQLARRVLRQYGERTASIVQQYPYRLALDVWGVGFKTADKIAGVVGIGKEHPERLEAGVLHELSQVSEQGHVFVDREQLESSAATMLAVDRELVTGAVDRLWAAERVTIEDGAVALTRLYEAERRLAQAIATYLDTSVERLEDVAQAIASFETATRIELSSQQRDAVAVASEQRVVVITGGPGVGKTTLVRAIVEVFDRAKIAIHLAAPTGRAAKRLSEATGREARTIHRLLEFDAHSFKFKRNANCPLDDGVVLIDEASMIDLALAGAVVDALPADGRFILVGDVDQLPSIGPGAVLRDLVESRRVPVVRLEMIFRQSSHSQIIKNAHRWQQGQLPEKPVTDAALGDFFVVERRDSEQAADDLVHLVTERIPQRFGFDAKRDIQVLTPMHRGPAGTIELNRRLQEAFNPEGAGVALGGAVVRCGDKVMQTRNDYDREVFNGDTGWVTNVDTESRRLTVDFEGRHVDYDSDELDALLLAYAISIHKSQGSEYPVVVVPVLTTHFVMLTRNLIYTAITRARKLCVLVADPRALRIAASENRREARFTRLAARLSGTISEGGVEGLAQSR